MTTFFDTLIANFLNSIIDEFNDSDVVERLLANKSTPIWNSACLKFDEKYTKYVVLTWLTGSIYDEMYNDPNHDSNHRPIFWDSSELREAGIKWKDHPNFRERIRKVADSLQMSAALFRYPGILYYNIGCGEYVKSQTFIKVTYLDQIQYLRYDIDYTGQLESVKYVTATPLQTLIFQEE